jgi:hypothetical protein
LKKRARLIDNDPLSPTDEVLLGFQQVSKSTSQQTIDAPALQPDEVPPDQSQPLKNLGMSASQPVDKPTSQQVSLQLSQQADLDDSQPASVSKSQKVNLLSPPPANVSDSQQVDGIGSQLADVSTSPPDNGSNALPAVIPASQQVDKLTLRKSTFQLTSAILQQLDVFHLHLQLELGKAKAPYKEVIVEEAICQLLATQDRQQLLTNLEQRQAQRSH